MVSLEGSRDRGGAFPGRDRGGAHPGILSATLAMHPNDLSGGA